MTARAPRAVPRPVVLGAAGVAVAVVIAVAAVAGAQLLTSSATSPSPSPAPLGQPLVIGPLPIGTYSARAFQPEFTFQIVDPGWTASRDGAEILGLLRDDAPRGSVYFLRVREVIENPCVEGGEGAGTRPGAADLLTKLGELEGLGNLSLSDPQTVRVGGYIGRQVRVTMSDGLLAACGGLTGGEASLFDAGEVWKVSPGELFTLISVDVSGQAVTILLSTDWTEIPSVQELESLLQHGQRVLDSVRF
jgi:hypothetical protein